MKKILWATDGSAGATQAGETAKQFLDAFSDATLVALYVSHPVYATATLGVAFVSELPEEDTTAVIDAVKSRVEEQFSGYGSRVQFKNVFGPPAISICKIAEEEQVDLIVVGSHGYGVVDRLLLGSVSNGVVHRAHVATLVVK